MPLKTTGRKPQGFPKAGKQEFSESLRIEGFLEMFVLSECGRKASSGREITETSSHLSGNNWKPSAGSLYPLLRKLENEGLLKSSLSDTEGSRGRREISYLLTMRGKSKLESMKKHLDDRFDALFERSLPFHLRIAGITEEEEMRQLLFELRLLHEFRDFLLTIPSDFRKKLMKKLVATVRDELLKSPSMGSSMLKSKMKKFSEKILPVN